MEAIKTKPADLRLFAFPDSAGQSPARRRDLGRDSLAVVTGNGDANDRMGAFSANAPQ